MGNHTILSFVMNYEIPWIQWNSFGENSIIWILSWTALINIGVLIKSELQKEWASTGWSEYNCFSWISLASVKQITPNVKYLAFV